MKKVLFVCLGNICRSPMAHGIFEEMVNEAGLGQLIRVDSAGTASYHIGSLPDNRARQTCMTHGISLTHKARSFVKADLEQYDYVLAMDKQNLADIKQWATGKQKAQIQLMRSYDSLKPNTDVPDPYYGELEGFEEVYTMLNRCCAELLQEIVKDIESEK